MLSMLFFNFEWIMHRTRMPFYAFTISISSRMRKTPNTEEPRSDWERTETEDTRYLYLAIEFYTVLERIAFFVEWILCLRIGNNKNKFISCTIRMKNNIWCVHKYLINECDGWTCGLRSAAHLNISIELACGLLSCKVDETQISAMI